jgi:hypothetical protein
LENDAESAIDEPLVVGVGDFIVLLRVAHGGKVVRCSRGDLKPVFLRFFELVLKLDFSTFPNNT